MERSSSKTNRGSRQHSAVRDQRTCPKLVGAADGILNYPKGPALRGSLPCSSGSWLACLGVCPGVSGRAWGCLDAVSPCRAWLCGYLSGCPAVLSRLLREFGAFWKAQRRRPGRFSVVPPGSQPFASGCRPDGPQLPWHRFSLCCLGLRRTSGCLGVLPRSLPEPGPLGSPTACPCSGEVKG